MAVQHLQPWLAHPAECPPKSGVIGMVMFVVDLGGSAQFFSFALTRVCLRFFDLLRLKQGLGTYSSSSGCGSMIDLSLLTSKSGVYSITRNVSYSDCFFVDVFSIFSLCWKGSDSCTFIINWAG